MATVRTQGNALTSITDPNTQATGYAYSYGTGTATTQVSEPGETNSYTTRSTSSSSCTTQQHAALFRDRHEQLPIQRGHQAHLLR